MYLTQKKKAGHSSQNLFTKNWLLLPPPLGTYPPLANFAIARVLYHFRSFHIHVNAVFDTKREKLSPGVSAQKWLKYRLFEVLIQIEVLLGGFCWHQRM